MTKSNQIFIISLVFTLFAYIVTSIAWFIDIYLNSFLAWEDPQYLGNSIANLLLYLFLRLWLIFLLLNLPLIIFLTIKKYSKLMVIMSLVFISVLPLMHLVAWGAGKIEELNDYKSVADTDEYQTISSVASTAGITLEPPETEEHIYYLPDGEVYSDIIDWKGKSLSYKTELAEEEIIDYYFSVYNKLGYKWSSSGSDKHWRETQFTTSDKSTHYLCVFVSIEEAPVHIVQITQKPDYCFYHTPDPLLLQ